MSIMVSVDGVKVILKKKKKVSGSEPETGVKREVGKLGVGCLFLLGHCLDRILSLSGEVVCFDQQQC